MIAEYERRRFTTDEFNRMAEAGIFASDERVELVEGHLVSYAPPQGPLHAGAVWNFPEVIRTGLGGRGVLWSQLPVVISDTCEFEPDLSILSHREPGYIKALPRLADVRAVVEIADSSIASDRRRKLPVYAAAGIPEYWLVGVRQERIQIYRDPRGPEYASYRLALRGDTISFQAFPDVAFSVDELLG